jgi:hypothetical protein
VITVVCWLWTPLTRYRSQFGQTHVNTLFRMVARHYAKPFDFVCITDRQGGFLPGVRTVPIWSDHADLRSLHGPLQPSCYRRLRIFDPAVAATIAKRFVSIDLDVVITGDLTPLFEREEDFVIWAWPFKNTIYNGTMWMMNYDARPQVWTEFDPVKSPSAAREAGFAGSDQAWLNYILGPNEATWTDKDGVHAFRTFRNIGRLPKGARLVSFHGLRKPWDEDVRQTHPWVLDHYF